MRIRSLILALLLAAFAGAEDKATPPKGAEEIAPHTYRYKDQAGKVWIYKQTPFGYVKRPEDALPEKSENASSTPSPFGPVKNSAPSKGRNDATPFGNSKASAGPGITKAVEEGDSIRFERPSPFGPYRWTRKKTDLTAAEQEAWDRLRKQTAESTTSKPSSR
jgi:hypothetical protein